MANCNAKWYHGNMSADTADNLCSILGKNGAFLVRTSRTVSGAFVLSLFYEHKVYHHMISRTSIDGHQMFCMEAANECFTSLEDLVRFYERPQPSFLHPLTKPVTKKVVRQFSKKMEPVYDSAILRSESRLSSSSHALPGSPQRSRINITPKQYIDRMRSLKDPKQTPGDEYEEVPPRRTEDIWPEPPPPLVPPKPPKHLSESSSDLASAVSNSRPLSCFELTGMSGFSTFGKDTDADELPSRMGRRHSLDTIPSIETKETEKSPKGMLPRRSKSLRYPQKSYEKEEKSDSKKALHNFTQIFRQASKRRPSAEELFTRTDEVVGNSEEAYAPISCKTTFVTISDSDGRRGAMKYQPGTEMLLEGVSVSGWWYCLNKTTNQRGWVFQHNLKTKEDQKWFEAKPLQPTQGSKEQQPLSDANIEDDGDDDTYCRYLMPIEAISQRNTTTGTT